jgi:glycerate kinase
LTVLADVENPLLGRDGAARVFAPQKGATPREVEQLDASLRHWANVLVGVRGHMVHAMRFGGAAGGLPAGLEATLGAECRSGFEAIADAVDLRTRLRWCDVCLTGEGRLDAQSLSGKVTVGVARLARELDRPVIACVGGVAATPHASVAAFASAAGFARILALRDESSPTRAELARTGTELRALAREHFRGR